MAGVQAAKVAARAASAPSGAGQGSRPTSPRSGCAARGGLAVAADRRQPRPEPGSVVRGVASSAPPPLRPPLRPQGARPPSGRMGGLPAAGCGVTPAGAAIDTGSASMCREHVRGAGPPCGFCWPWRPSRDRCCSSWTTPTDSTDPRRGSWPSWHGGSPPSRWECSSPPGTPAGTSASGHNVVRPSTANGVVGRGRAPCRASVEPTLRRSRRRLTP